MSSKECNERFKSLIPRPDCPSLELDNRNPIWFQRAKGAYLYSVDGKKFIDLCNGKGSVTLGHGDEDVNSAIIESIRSDSNCVSGPNPLIIEVAESILSHSNFPNGSVALFPTGTEALRAIAATLKDLNTQTRPVLLSSGWHGWDPMWRIGPSLLEPNGEGVIDFFFVPELLESSLHKYGKACAAIVISPDPHYVSQSCTKDIITLANKYGVPVVWDDVKHGYRWCIGSSLGLFQGTAEYIVYSKGLSNGRRIAAVACSHERELSMGHFTYTNIFETSVLAATKATLAKCTKVNFFNELSRTGEAFISGFRDRFYKHNPYLQIEGQGPVFQLVFGSDEFARRFYECAVSEGLIFYPYDNQTPSYCFNAGLVNDALNICELAINRVFDSGKHIEKVEIDEKRKFVTAWRQIDGATDIFEINRISLIEQMIFGGN